MNPPNASDLPPGHKRDNCPGLPREFNLSTYTRLSMTDWFSVGVLLATGARDLLSQVFAAYADRRATIAALRPADTYDALANRETLWFDFVADVGDGWDSTYSIAWCLAQPEHQVLIADDLATLHRGDLLVMGGDEVYPYASAETYNQRLERPYQAALPCTPEGKHPALFALPGNHDWTDGLRGFMRRFCQGAWLGGWKTHQARPYWSIKLPHGWWLWGVDSQMDDYIDQAQVDYFRETAKDLDPGDRVILCVAAPSWIYAAEGDDILHRNLAFIENEIICKHGAHLVLSLSGDLHHFAHYSANDTEDGIARHKITCGGGGAFTHGTHHLPEIIHLVEQDQRRDYLLETETTTNGNTEAKVLPSRNDSRVLLWKNLLFPLNHPSFAVLLGGFYFVYALVLADTDLLAQLSMVPMHWVNAGFAALAYTRATFSHFLPLLFFALLVGSGYAFAQPDWHSNPEKKHVRKLIAGLIHSLMHLVVLVPLLWTMAHSSAINLPPLPPDWGSMLEFGAGVYIFGAVAGGLVFGIYLSLSNLFFGFHRTEAFSAVRNANNKSFLRMHIDQDGLVIYPLGLKEVEYAWREDPEGGENHSWIQPSEPKKLVPQVIGKPIKIR
ncbi:MAG: hypothetical protein R3188_01325 [Acidiferrobacterales bacterium]|nr:hypothetical protein [Acidiferrobacterales bacterium]